MSDQGGTSELAEVPWFGGSLAAARESIGVKAADAATRVGMDRSNYWRVERVRRNPSWSMAWRLLVGLNLDLSRFFPPEQVLLSARLVEERQRASEGMKDEG